MRIRPAVAADIPGITALDAEVTRLAKPAYWETMFARFGARPEEQRFFLVAETERIEGFIVGEIRAWEFGSPPCGWIFAVQVRPDARLRGTGTQLFEAMCAAFREAGVDKVRTMLARDDTVLLSFFRGQGMMAGPFIQLELSL